jgi:small GTP-binding protein
VVGKTSVIQNYFHGVTAGSTIPTVGADFYKREVSIDGVHYLLQVWDTAGQDRFRSISVSYFRRGDVILLFYAANSRDTFERLQFWQTSIEEGKQADNVPVVLGANKIDLVRERSVTTAEGQALAAKSNWPYCETSALTGEGINELFETAIREAITKRHIGQVSEIARPDGDLKLDSQEKRDKNCC